MKNNLNISREIVDDPIASQLIMYMKNLSEDRKNFIEAISFIEGYFQSDLNDIKDILNDISMRYEKLRAYIIKCAFSHKNHKPDVISTELNYIYSSEHQIYNILSSLVKRNEERAYD